MEKNGAVALYSAVKGLMHAIQTADENAQQDVAHRMIQIGMLVMKTFSAAITDIYISCYNCATVAGCGLWRPTLYFGS